MLKTNLIPPTVSSNASALAGGDIHPIKAPVPIPNLWLWVAMAVAVLALAALGVWLWRRRKRQKALPAAIPVIPPDKKARAKLQEALSLLDQPRPFCILVSDTIRVYLEERFNLHAPERTTEEFLEELSQSPALSLEQKRTLGEFLMGCDLVKFAKYEPAREELQAIYDSAIRLIDETVPAPAPVQSSGAASASRAG